MSKKDPKRSGRSELKKSMKQMLHDRFSKKADEKGMKPKGMSVTVTGDSKESVSQGLSLAEQMFKAKFDDENESDEE